MLPRIASNRVSKTHQAPDPHGYHPKATLQVEHRKVIAAVPIAASNLHHDDHDEEQGQEVVIHDSAVNDSSNLSQNSVAKAFLQAVARRRGAGPASSASATQQPKPSISSKLGRSHDHHHQHHHTARDDQASVDVNSIRSLFESKDKIGRAPGNGQPDHDDDDDTVSVRSLKEIFEPPQGVQKKAILESKRKRGLLAGNDQNDRDDDDTVSIKSLKEVFEPPQIAKKCDDQSTSSSIGRLRAMFEAKQPKPASKGKFTDSNSVAKLSFSIFEEQSKRKDVGRSMPPRKTTSKQSVQQRPIRTTSAAFHSSNCDNSNDDSTEDSCPIPHFVGNIDVTMSEASILQGLAMSTDPSNDLSPPNRGRPSKQPDPSPMRQGQSEKVLTKRFRSESSGSFRRSSSAGSATDNRKGGTEQAPVRGKVSGDVDHALSKEAQISAKGYFPVQTKNAQTQAATKASLPGLSNVMQIDRNSGRGKGSGSGSSGSGLDAHLQTRQAQNTAKEDFPGLSNAIQEACQSSKAESSTERALNSEHLPERSTSQLVRSFSHLTTSFDNQGHSSPIASKSTSHAFDSPGSSDFTDGVTLDASIMDVSVLTNPTELIRSSRGGRRRRRHDSDGSEDSKNDQKHSDEIEAAAKQSEASSSQPSMSAVPLLAKLMMNLPQSDEFSALVSKHSKLKRIWSQSQDSDDCSDEEHDLRMAYGYDALTDTDEARWNLHHVHTLFPSKQPVVSGIKSKKEYVSDWEPFEEAATATESKEKPKQLLPADKVQIKSTNEKSTSQRRDLAGVDVQSRWQTSDIFDKSVSSVQCDPEKSTFPFARKHQLPMRQTIETPKLRPTAATKMIPSVSLAAARAPKPFMSASSSSESTRQHGNLANRATLEKKEQRFSYLSRYAQAAHVSLQGQREANIAASVRSDSETPSIISTSAKGSTHVQAYLKAWRGKVPAEANSPKTAAPLNRQQPAAARPVPTPRSRPERQKSLGHVEVPQSIRQRSLHAEDADLLKPTVSALDSPRARDFEGRAIRRLRMRQMIDSFEQSPGVRSVVPLDQDCLSDNADLLCHKTITRSSFFSSANSNIHHRPSSRSDPGVATQSLQAGRGSFTDRAARSLISRRANSRQSPVRDPTRNIVNLDLLSEATTANGSSSDGTYASPRTPRSQLIERFNQRLTPEQSQTLNYEEINFSAASAALGSTTPTRSNISYQRDLSVHSDAVDIMPFLLPALETAKPTNRYTSSSVGSTSLSRSVAPASLSSDVVGYASTSGSSSLYAKSVAGAPGHSVYRPKYTALRNRLRTLRESRLRREHGKQEFMESPTAVVDGLPTRFKS
jgi:hypothetical protein